MVGSAAIKQGRSANRKHTYFFFAKYVIFEPPQETVLLDKDLYLFCLFCCFTSQVNSYGHGGTVSSLNHTFFLGKLEQAVNQYFVCILSLVTDNPS